MSITINVTPELEQRLRDRAASEGQDVEVVAADLLAEALDWEQRDREAEDTGIQRGLDDFAAGRYRPFEEFANEQRAKYGLAND